MSKQGEQQLSGDSIAGASREVLEENLRIVQEHVPKLIDRLSAENQALRDEGAAKDARIAQLEAQLAQQQ